MEQLRKGFEITLKSKLAQKSTGNQSEETFLIRNFRHFDTDNDGFVSMNEWFKAIEKVGVVVPSMDDLRALFKHYDINGDGQIDYKEFSHILYTKQKPEYILNLT